MDAKAEPHSSSSISSETSYDSNHLNHSTSFKSDNGDRAFNVYVKGFSPETDTKKLEEMFSDFGAIQSCIVLCDHAGRNKQVGFVQFSSDEEANRAVKEMHGKEGFGIKPLHAALTNPKPPRSPKKVFAPGVGIPFAGAMSPPAFAVPFAAAPQPAVFPPGGGWAPSAGPVPLVFFTSPYSAPHFAPPQQPAAARALGYEGPPVSQPGTGVGQPGVFHPGPYMVPIAPNTGGGMMMSRPVRMHPPHGFAPGFCTPLPPFHGFAWAPAFGSHSGPAPAIPAKTRFVS